jgi:hypothetical protein
LSNKYLREYLIPVATTETEIYTVPAANAGILSSLRITNGNTGTAVISVTLYPEGGSTPHYLLDQYALPVDGTMDVFSGIPCVMQAGDTLKVTASEDDITFYLSYLEVDRN